MIFWIIESLYMELLYEWNLTHVAALLRQQNFLAVRILPYNLETTRLQHISGDNQVARQLVSKHT